MYHCCTQVCFFEQASNLAISCQFEEKINTQTPPFCTKKTVVKQRGRVVSLKTKMSLIFSREVEMQDGKLGKAVAAAMEKVSPLGLALF